MIYMTIYFYKEFGPLGYLASYSNHGFYKNGKYWATVEHFYQAHKFLNTDLRENIRHVSTPKEASKIGRDKDNPLRKHWEYLKLDIMFEAVYRKFMSHSDIRILLLLTNNAEIIEETTKENYWGCGSLYDGKNMFGKILMSVRCLMRRIEKMYFISKKGYETKYNEFLNVDNEIIETNREMGESAKRDNDLRENQEFMQLRVKAMYELPQKKERLRLCCENAIIIEDMDEFKNFDGTKVIIGSTVKLDFEGDICEYTILGSEEGDIDNGILSCEAPIAQAILGKQSGEEVEFNVCKIVIKEITIS